MPRSPRSHLPGGVFHLVARTLGKRGRFPTSLRRRILVDMAEVFERSDAGLLAYAIMPNHLHLVVKQGDRPLSSFMQPLLRRVALRVQRAHRTEGHIFERRFRDRVCLEPYYIRNAILYNHLNRVRARLAAGPDDDGEWTSHTLYAGDDGPAHPLGAVLSHRLGLGVFAPDPDADLDATRRSYRAFVAWRMEADRCEAARRGGAAADSDRPDPPSVVGGHRPWAESFPGLGPVPAPLGDGRIRRRRRPPSKPPDLADIARRTLAGLGLDVDLERVRSPFKGRAEARARREIVRRQSDAGHPNHAIARYLRVSPQCVSTILVGRGHRTGE